MNIVPGILVKSETEFHEQIEKARGLVEWVQIDIEDGKFVEPVSVILSDLPDDALGGMSAEAHLMVADPERYIDDCVRLGFKRVILHIGAVADPRPILHRIKDLGMQPALALNPEDDVTSLDPYLESVEAVLIMTIQPGPQGQALMFDQLEKARELRMLEPDIIIGIDGGVKLENVEQVAEYPLDYAVVGSGLWQADDVAERIGSFRAKLV